MSKLLTIVRHTLTVVEAAKAARPLAEMRARLSGAPPVRDFLNALAAPGPIKLIAEIKRKSPSQGEFRRDFDPLAIARTYAQHGATCISVLTDEEYFGGRLEYLTQIRQVVDLPLLRKDFILDHYQLSEGRAAGADAVLLIAECFTDPIFQEYVYAGVDNLRRLYDEAVELGLTPLVEFFREENLDVVLDLGARLIGVNNRDLHTFIETPRHALNLRPTIPEDRVFVAESCIGRGTNDPRSTVVQHEQAGVQALLVGEYLMRAGNPGQAITTLLGQSGF